MSPYTRFLLNLIILTYISVLAFVIMFYLYPWLHTVEYIRTDFDKIYRSLNATSVIAALLICMIGMSFSYISELFRLSI